jgi:hypothetical protein
MQGEIGQHAEVSTLGEDCMRQAAHISCTMLPKCGYVTKVSSLPRHVTIAKCDSERRAMRAEKKGRVGEYQVRASGTRWLTACCTRKLRAVDIGHGASG